MRKFALLITFLLLGGTAAAQVTERPAVTPPAAYTTPGELIADRVGEVLQQLDRLTEEIEQGFDMEAYGACAEYLDIMTIAGEILPIERVVALRDDSLYGILVGDTVVSARPRSSEFDFPYILRDLTILGERAAAGTAWFVLQVIDGGARLDATALSLGGDGCQLTGLTSFVYDTDLSYELHVPEWGVWYWDGWYFALN